MRSPSRMFLGLWLAALAVPAAAEGKAQSPGARAPVRTVRARAPSAPGAPLELRRARVELLEGRAHLAGPQGVLELRAGGQTEVEGRAYLEVRARSRAALRWNAVASLVVEGPAVLEWGPAEGEAGLEWRIEELFEAHLEVRRGPVRARLAGGWSARLEAGAGFLRGIAGGGVEWHHDAGSPVLLSAPHAPRAVRPPWVVLPGAWLRLHPGRTRPGVVEGYGGRLLDPYLRRGSSRTVGTSTAWPGFSWPWVEPEPAPGRSAPCGDDAGGPGRGSGGGPGQDPGPVPGRNGGGAPRVEVEDPPLLAEPALELAAEPPPTEGPADPIEPAPELRGPARAQPGPHGGGAEPLHPVPGARGPGARGPGARGPGARGPEARGPGEGADPGEPSAPRALAPLDVEVRRRERAGVTPPGESTGSDSDPRPFRPYAEGGVLRLTPWGVRRFHRP